MTNKIWKRRFTNDFWDCPCLEYIYGLGNIILKTTVLLIIHNWYNREISHIKPATVHLRPVREEVAYQAGWLEHCCEWLLWGWGGDRKAFFYPANGRLSQVYDYGEQRVAFISLRRIIIIALQIHGVLLERTYEQSACHFSYLSYTLLISRRPYHPLYCMLLPYILSGNNTEMNAVFVFSVPCRICSRWVF